MKKTLLSICFLLILATNLYANPSNSISVPYPAVANNVISSSEYNANSNEVQTKFNSHTHSDISTLGTITTGIWAATPIGYSFLTLTGSIVNADISASAAIDSSKVNGTVPVGGIIMWSGSVASIPSNWQICDGTNGTPDLRDRFVVGAGSSYAVGATGGSATSNALIAHTHTIPDIGAGGPNQGAYGEVYSSYAKVAGGTSGSAGSGSSFSILPPYYALAYIQRMS